MGQPAARLGDMHVCPMQTPGVPPIPHVGGPIILGSATVLIGGQPAATMGNPCICTGPVDTIVKGSTGVFIEGKPAARLGDTCAHGGAITGGCPTVLIGEVGIGTPVVTEMIPAAIAETATPMETQNALVTCQINAGLAAAIDGTPFLDCESCRLNNT